MPQMKAGDLFLDRYLIVEELGSGGMGVVYLAKQVDVGRDVAIKVPHLETRSGFDHDRFFRECKNLARLSHANIMSIYGITLDDEIPIAVCEYVKGRSLRDAIFQKGTFEWRSAVRVVIQICHAMQYAHELGILHRDLKPENIMLLDAPEPDFVKLIDFGLSRVFNEINESQKLTKTGMVVGSPHYLAPESLKDAKDKRSDIYSVGCLFYEMLSGSYLFDASSAIEILSLQCKQNPDTRLKLIASKVPQELVGILKKALEKEPEARYQSMADLAEALEKLLIEQNLTYATGKQASAIRMASYFILCLLLLGAGIVFFKQAPFSKKLESSKSSALEVDSKVAVKVPVENILEKGIDLAVIDPVQAIETLENGFRQLKGASVPDELLYQAHWKLGLCYQNQMKDRQAIREYKSALHFTTAGSLENLQTATALGHLLAVKHMSTADSQNISAKAIKDFEKSNGGDLNITLLHAKNLYASSLVAAGDFKQAFSAARETLKECDDKNMLRSNADIVSLVFTVFDSAKSSQEKRIASAELQKTKKGLLNEASQSADQSNVNFFGTEINNANLAQAISLYGSMALIHNQFDDASKFSKLALSLIGEDTSLQSTVSRNVSNQVLRELMERKIRASSSK